MYANYLTRVDARQHASTRVDVVDVNAYYL